MKIYVRCKIVGPRPLHLYFQQNDKDTVVFLSASLFSENPQQKIIHFKIEISKGIVVNLTCNSINGGSLEITSLLSLMCLRTYHFILSFLASGSCKRSSHETEEGLSTLRYFSQGNKSSCVLSIFPQFFHIHNIYLKILCFLFLIIRNTSNQI